MYYVYILFFDYSKYSYKGITNNIERRLEEHANGHNKFTKRHAPYILIHVEICEGRIEARRMEKFFKSGFGREIISEIAQEI